MTAKIRIGIIGLGYLGKFHYQKYMSNPSVNVTSVVDTDKTNFQIIKDRNIFKSKLSMIISVFKGLSLNSKFSDS